MRRQLLYQGVLGAKSGDRSAIYRVMHNGLEYRVSVIDERPKGEKFRWVVVYGFTPEEVRAVGRGAPISQERYDSPEEALCGAEQFILDLEGRGPGGE